MTEMMERVARDMARIAEREGFLGTFANVSNEMARAAIEAMRQPTDKMRWSIPRRFGELSYRDVGDIWRAMIDAALEKSK